MENMLQNPQRRYKALFAKGIPNQNQNAAGNSLYLMLLKIP